MSSKCSCTSRILCSGCQLLMVDGSNHGLPNSERVGRLPELASSSVVASQAHSVTPEQQPIHSLSEYDGRLHLFSHVHDGQYQPQLQKQSVPNVMVDVNPMNIEKHTVGSTSTLQPLQNQIGGIQGPLLAPHNSDEQRYIEQQMLHDQQYGQLLMMASKTITAQRLQKMSTMQDFLPNQPLYVPGNCAKRLLQFMHQLHRNANASKEFWKDVVAEFFAPNAKKRWCFSLCKNRPKQNAPFAQRKWHCHICKLKPGCGYEVTAEVLPALSTVGYETGILQELLYVDIPSEHQTVSGEIALHYDKATAELVYQNLRVVHDGHLCVVFTPNLKISSWDFCIRNIEQFISGRTLVPQVDKLQVLSSKYNRAAQNASPHLQLSELIRLYEAACGFQKALNLPPVTDVGFTRRYLRYIEMSEVVACMGDLIDHSLATGMSARMSLAVLGGLSNEDGMPASNRNLNRPRVQLDGDSSNKYSEAAAETIERPNITCPFSASTPSSSCSDTESSDSP